MLINGPPLLLVVLVGIPGSGKSTLSRALIAGAPRSGREWSRISQDMLGTRKRCVQAAKTALRQGNHVLVDRCNFDAQQRAHWTQLRVESDTSFDHSLAVYLPVPPEEALQRVLSRGVHEGGVDTDSMSREKIASIVSRMQDDLRPPDLSEGFDEVLRVDADDSGSQHGSSAVLQRIWALADGNDDPTT